MIGPTDATRRAKSSPATNETRRSGAPGLPSSATVTWPPSIARMVPTPPFDDPGLPFRDGAPRVPVNPDSQRISGRPRFRACSASAGDAVGCDAEALAWIIRFSPRSPTSSSWHRAGGGCCGICSPRSTTMSPPDAGQRRQEIHPRHRPPPLNRHPSSRATAASGATPATSRKGGGDTISGDRFRLAPAAGRDQGGDHGARLDPARGGGRGRL